MQQPQRVLVVVPARDEQGSVGDGVRAVQRALDHFVDECRGPDDVAPGAAGTPHACVGVVVVAHRCSDDTASVAEEAMRAWQDDDRLGLVVEDAASSTVGQVRALGVERFHEEFDWPRESTTWIFSADADEVVPVDWVTGTLAEVSAASEDMEDGDVAEPVAMAARAEDDPRPPTLVVRLDAYDNAGGFTQLGASPASSPRAAIEAPRPRGEAADLIPGAAREWWRLVDGIAADQWDLPTPCSDWTVRDLVRHLVAEQLWAPHLLAGQTLEDVGDRYDGDVLGDTPRVAAADAVERFVDEWRRAAEGGAQETVHTSTGPIPVGEYAQQMLLDLVVHGWDLARATGQSMWPSPAAVAAGIAYESPRVIAGQTVAIFDEPVPTDSADPLDRLVALLGRDPGWVAPTPGA